MIEYSMTSYKSKSKTIRRGIWSLNKTRYKRWKFVGVFTKLL